MMISSPERRDLINLAARIAVGALFVYLGAMKAVDPVAFLKLLRQLGFLPQPLVLNAVAGLLPWFEVYCGVLLLAGIRPRGTALVAAVLLFVFTALLTWRALAIYRVGATSFCAIRFDCGCGTGEVLICMKLAENVAAAMLASLIVLQGSRRWCLWPDPP